MLLRQRHGFQIPASADFMAMAEWARQRAMESEDPAVAFAAANVPIFTMPYPTTGMAQAGGCGSCTYLGLWASDWPGYEPSEHGIIWLFEHGITTRARNGDVQQQTLLTLEHEIDHALQRDHVLEAMQRQGLRPEACG